MVAAIAVLWLAQAASAVSPPARAVAPLPGNKPCAYPDAAREALVSGSVVYRASITPAGAVDSVNVLAVPIPDLGFEDAVRACIAEWRFEPVPNGPDSRTYVGAVRFALVPDQEAAVRSLLAQLAAAWNTGDTGALEKLEARGDDLPGLSQDEPFLAALVGAAKDTDECHMELEPSLGYMRFLAHELVQVKQPFACVAPSANSEAPESVTLELGVGRSSRGWRFVDLSRADAVWNLTRRAGRDVPEPRVLKRVEARYPPIAREVRAQGPVVLECVVTPEGKVVQIRVLKGYPLLDQAALDALRQWEFEPTIVNGRPVPVIVTVTMAFKLP
jgi:TonB family protein